MPDLFVEVKTGVQIVNVLKYYGVPLKSSKKAVCCFHREKTPSLIIYPATNSWYCFGCGSGGSVIDFVQKLYNLEPLEAAQKLNEDFNLGIDTGKPVDMEAVRMAENDRELLKSFETWISNTYITLCDYFHLLRDFKANNRPENLYSFDNKFIEAVHNIDYIEYLIDILMFADFEEQTKFYKTYKKEVADIAARIELYRESREDKAN